MTNPYKQFDEFEREDMADSLEKAENLMWKALTLIEEVVDRADDRWARAYIVDQLRDRIEGGYNGAHSVNELRGRVLLQDEEAI